MTRTLVLKLLRDYRLGLIVVALLLFLFQLLWSLVAKRISSEVLQAFAPFGVGVEQQLAHVTAGDLARFVDQLPALVVRPGPPHTRALGPLARERECEHRVSRLDRFGVAIDTTQR